VSVVDVSSQIASHGGSTTINVPSGSSSAAPAAAVYGVALRTWVAGSDATTARWTRTNAPISLSTSSTANVTLVLP
jgi:hypothetical protein